MLANPPSLRALHERRQNLNLICHFGLFSRILFIFCSSAQFNDKFKMQTGVWMNEIIEKYRVCGQDSNPGLRLIVLSNLIGNSKMFNQSGFLNSVA